MSVKDSIKAAAEKEYKDFESEIKPELEAKMKTYLSGFQDYLTKNAFQKEE